YNEHLRAMGKKSGLKDFNVKSEEASIARIPAQVFNKKETFYTPLNFTVTGHGDFSSVVKLLEEFYSTPLLHKIKSLVMRRPNSGAAAKTREVEIELKVEAIIVDGAENRPQLLPTEKVEPHNLAVPKRDYLMIAAKNPFYGPPPPPTKPDDGP